MATPVNLLMREVRFRLFSVVKERSRFVRSFAKVDFPDDFGPHIMTTGVFWPGGVGNLDKAWFHSGVDMIGCR